MCSSDDPDTTPSKARRLGQLVFCAGGICLCYLTYGLLQERLYSDTTTNDPALILFTQCITNVLVALIWNGASVQPFLPHRLLQATSLCYVTAMLCSNEAIVYVSYPVLVLAKSCKLIPTMVIGQLVEGRNLYRTSEWLAALGICCGILLFQSSHFTSNNDSNNTPTGLILLSISLTMDGVLSACQNRIKQQATVPNAAETMLCLNAYAAFLLVPYCLVKSHFTGKLAITTLSALPSSQWMLSLCILNLTAAMGQIFIFLGLSWFHSTTVTVITTTRKFLTIFVSVLYYGHHFSTTQWSGVVMVFCALYACIYQTVARQDEKKQKHV